MDDPGHRWLYLADVVAEVAKSRLAAVVVLLVTMSGCGVIGGGTPRSWIAEDSTSVLLIQFTRSHDELQGTLDLAQLDGPDAQSVTSRHEAFTGRIDGSRITLTFSQGFGIVTTISGTIGTRELALNFPDSSTGNLAIVTLHPGSTNDYTKAVRALSTKASENTELSAQASASAAAEAEVRSGSRAVANDVKELRLRLEQGLDLNGVNAALDNAKANLNETEATAAGARRQGPGDEGCYEAGLAVYDASLVRYDAGQVEYEAGRLTDQIRAIRDLVNRLRADYDRFIAILADRGKTIDAENANVVATLIDQVVKQTDAWSNQVTGYVTQAHGITSQAETTADAAEKALC